MWPFGYYCDAVHYRQFVVDALNWVSAAAVKFTLNKLKCSKQAFRLYSFAWNNRIGLTFYCVGFKNESND